jgi:hypothetical protein
MIKKLSVGLLMASLVLVASASVGAQDDVKTPKGVAVKGLVTSLGGFSATVSAPILVTGSTVVLAPGGRTGREQFRVPTYVYVIEGILTTEYEAGPVGIKGAQYHSAGQSYMDNGSWWHNNFNRGDKPVKYLLLHLGYPGRPDPIQKAEPE